MTSPPPGWYPDPAPPPAGGPSLVRYWDGQRWSGHVSPAPGQPSPQPWVGTPWTGQTAVTQPGPTTPDGVPLASWWMRAAAYLIDGVLVGAVNSVATLPLQMGLQQDMQELLRSEPEPRELLSAYVDTVLPMLMWSALVGLAIWTIYQALMLRLKGATVGKLALGLAVRLRDRPGRLPWSAILARILVQQGYALTAVVPLLYLALSWYPLLDNLWASWDGKRQALHDKAARTNVVRTR